MARLFGTDGIRGVVNVDLKPPIAYALGRAVAHRLVGRGGAIVVGQDTRRSGDMFVAAIIAGATSLGVDVHVVGVVPTPALAYITGVGPYDAGIMVSASHNPALDNGLKVLDAQGLKLDDAIEDELEQLIWRTDELSGVANAELGTMVDAAGRLDDYRAHRLALASTIDARGMRLVLDAANGSGSVVAPAILAATGAAVEVIHAAPDGVNINVEAGATAPASLAATVVAAGADVGFALDGDADRLIAVDADGSIVDGDQVLGILALDRLRRDGLPGGGLVVSVLSNGGLQAAVEAAGGQVVRTPVGDKYILEGMQVSGAVLGGEKSGHVIVLEHTTSGDGIVTALEVLRVMTSRNASLAELASAIPLLPQQQRAVKARHKDQWEGDPVLQRAITAAGARLGPGGRVLVRPSGTEPALRVMVEGADEALVIELADALATLAGERLD
ncbi:MAG TPA: phosphoglucosamine mutase [Candidatus Limnocylindrales bacterium]|jgi:phosphoglucosamine mutase|nr:phosphoglucosamine mutase [Candidatus Limnocylindrales bacterium]